MDRRKSLKTMFVGGVASSFLLNSCITDHETPIQEGAEIEEGGEGYGRTPTEEAYDQELRSKTFFTESEMAIITVLSDIIIPEDGDSVSATQSGVPEFIEFIVKDMPHHQIPMRGGLMWINRESNLRYDMPFVEISKEQQLEIIDDIAYPEKTKKNSAGPIFFRHIRNLVVTGYFTSEPGVKYLDYRGNQPNVWDGVPDDVLKKHGMSYDQRTLDIALDPNNRSEPMNWDNYEI